MEDQLDQIITELSNVKREMRDLVKGKELNKDQTDLVKAQILKIKKMQSDLLNLDELE